MLKIVTDDADRDDLAATLDELVAEGALRMLIAGFETEVADYIERHHQIIDAAGRRLVVRNGGGWGAHAGDRCRCAQGSRSEGQ